MKNEKLAIAIPTYNRAEILKENLLYMMDDIKKHNIPIYISDDSNNDDTKMIITELKSDYKYIYYHKNEPSLGHDKNCFATLNLPHEEYVWYIGDSIIIENDSLSKIMHLIENNTYDFIITNHQDRNVNLPSKFYDDKKDVFLNLSWHLTLTGATIYNKKTLLDFSSQRNCKNFPQTSIILEYLCKECNLYYESKVITSTNKNKTSYWNSKVFETFAKDWVKFINSLPVIYNDKEKKLVIKSHSIHTNIFGIRRLVNYRINGYLNLLEYIKYYRYLNMASHVNTLAIIIIVITPVKMLQLLKRLKSEN
ncbi:glycosyl transferase family 2 [Candidatus Woesearchaeota archaeon]|jgi:hypothetical protein|nr:MAG: glycosyl transferase family 2 [Candidatus Woesearchaeota archaeon]